MTNYDTVFSLAKKLAKALSRGNKPIALEESQLFNDQVKQRLLQEVSEETCERQIAKLTAIDTNEDWNKVVSKISSTKQSSFKHTYKVAAAILILISVGSLTFYNGIYTSDLDHTITEISAGTNKAILTLQTGVDIVLEKEKPFENDVIKSDGERLKYSQANTNSKIVFNYLTIPRGGQYQIQLSDGTLVWLNADTKLKYPVAFKSGETRTVELLYGEAYFDVSPSSNHEGNTFKVLTKNQEVEVLGTEFNIKAYNDEHYMYTTLVEGQVNILVDGISEQLNPSEQATIDTETGYMTKSIVNVDYHIAWVKGYFNFKSTSLQEIMLVLSRWYDVDITFKSRAMENVKFSGLLNKKQNIEDILNGIQNTKFINAYEIKNKTITIK